MQRSSKNIIRALMDPSQPDVVAWSPSELRAILEHLLGTSLSKEIEQPAEGGQISEEQANRIAARGAITFHDALNAVNPDVGLLILIKSYAKASCSTGGDLPRDVARVLYISAILSARRCGGTNISSLSVESVERETRRCLTFGWLPEKARLLLCSEQ